MPTDARGERKGKCRRHDRPDAPTILGHARTDTELLRLEELDAICIDDDVIRRPRDRNQDRCLGGRHQTCLWIDES
jgi:hypothetical protein